MDYNDYILFDPTFVEEIEGSNKLLVHHLNETFGDSSYPRLNVLHFTLNTIDKEYIIEFRIRNSTNKGAMTTDVLFKNAQGDVVAKILDLKTRGAKRGTLANLIGDGFEKLADEFYGEVQDAMKHKII